MQSKLYDNLIMTDLSLSDCHKVYFASQLIRHRYSMVLLLLFSGDALVSDVETGRSVSAPNNRLVDF